MLDTHQELPLKEHIDWNRLGLMIPLSDLNRAGALVAEFHSKQTADGFRELQCHIRKTWEDFFTRDAFTKRFVNDFLQGGNFE
jgi:hypothetical protein